MIFDKDTKTTQGGKDSFFNKQHWENKISTCKRTRVDIYLTPYVKINSKWIKHLKVRPKTRKLLEKDIGEKLHDIGFGHYFLNVTPKADNKSKTRQIGQHQTGGDADTRPTPGLSSRV